MIQPKELSKYAALHKVSDRQIEKDYVLTWVLFGISNQPILSKILVFKGGTVLKKCYFEDYRFSEDLDFTIIDLLYSHTQFKDMLTEVFEWIKAKTNMTLQHKADDTHTASGSSQFYVDYQGPLGGAIGSRDIKIDLTKGERLEYTPVYKNVFITYSDLPEDSFSLLCYPLSEILIEKMAALMGRTEPRDFYDFWYLTEIDRLNVKEHWCEFERKAEHKGLDPTMFESKVLKKQGAFEKGWNAKLQNQIHDLPKFEDIFREAKRYFKLK